MTLLLALGWLALAGVAIVLGGLAWLALTDGRA